jgi:hypothetical protein
MDDRDHLAFYPFVVVRIACRVCSRSGSYRLARLAAKFGPEITLRDLTTGSPMIAYGAQKLGRGQASRPVGCTCQTSQIHVPLSCHQGS